jgi:hypothetical protein
MKQQPKPEVRVNTRADARRLFPTWTRKAQARWVLAKLRTRGGVWATRIGIKHVESPDYIPEFVHRLPAGPRLVIVDDYHDRVRKVRQYLYGGFK